MPRIPLCSSLDNNKLWSMVSNVFDKSNKKKTTRVGALFAKDSVIF